MVSTQHGVDLKPLSVIATTADGLITNGTQKIPLSVRRLKGATSTLKLTFRYARPIQVDLMAATMRLLIAASWITAVSYARVFQNVQVTSRWLASGSREQQRALSTTRLPFVSRLLTTRGGSQEPETEAPDATELYLPGLLETVIIRTKVSRILSVSLIPHHHWATHSFLADGSHRHVRFDHYPVTFQGKGTQSQ